MHGKLLNLFLNTNILLNKYKEKIVNLEDLWQWNTLPHWFNRTV